ncbi:MAG: arginase family protein, partial [Thermoplasmata archaeon]|nr:arginase family protein [Thermoplasmata archaeon]
GEFGSTEDMAAEVTSLSERLASLGKFSIAIGGEHSIAPPVVEALVPHFPGDLGILVIDAHLDFRDEYLGDRQSHACASRRFTEMVGVEKVLPVGVRSFCKKEMEDAKELDMRWVTAKEAQTRSPADVVKKALQDMDVKHLYLSLDIDGIDPAYAPGTGTPEPFGLTAEWTKELIQAAAPALVGMDVVEVCPPVDNGNTSILAARFIREVIAATWKVRTQKGMWEGLNAQK